MTDDDAKKVARETANEVLIALKREGFLRDESDIIYSEASQTLRGYYSAKTDDKISGALDELRGEPYFEILPMYYCDGMTIEAIAEELDVAVSTVKRQKKRLCLAIARNIKQIGVDKGII